MVGVLGDVGLAVSNGDDGPTGFDLFDVPDGFVRAVVGTSDDWEGGRLVSDKRE